MAETTQIKKAGGVTKESDTRTIIIQGAETTRSDLEYLAGKLGIDLNELQKERIAKERQTRQAVIDKRAGKKLKARQAQEERLDREFLEHYGSQNGHFLLSINGKRIHKLKSFDEITCPFCGVALPLNGYCHTIMEQHSFTHPFNPLSEFLFIPAREGSVRCVNGHEVRVAVQCLI